MDRRVGAAAGAVLFAVGFGFCLRTGIAERDRVAAALEGASPSWLAASMVTAAATMLVIATGWGRCLAVLGTRLPARRVGAWFFVGELGKYVPGAVWPILGRGELAHRGGVDRRAAYGSVGLSLLALYGAAVLPVAVVVSHPRVQGVAAAGARILTGGRAATVVLPWGRLVRLVLSYLPAWLLVATTTAAVVRAFGEAAGWQAPAAAVLAWVCGFLAVPVPAGAGVREAVFVATSGLDPGLALTVAVTARLAYVLTDLVAGAVAAPSVRAEGVGALVQPSEGELNPG